MSAAEELDEGPAPGAPARVRLRFAPSGIDVKVPGGVTVFDAASWNGIAIDSTCGGHGTCRKCRVRITEGDVPVSKLDSRAFTPDELREGWRLACRITTAGDLDVEVPPLQTRPKAATAGVGRQVILRPSIVKRHLVLEEATLADQRTDVQRVLDAMDDLELAVPLPVLRTLGATLRSANWDVTAVIAGAELIAVEPGDTSERCYGIAFDIGTTTIVGSLINLRTGEDMAVAAKMNPQTSFGDDVVTRIQRCRTEGDGLSKLQSAVLKAVREIIEKLFLKTSVPADAIYEVVFAGNTTMQEILCGIDPSPLGELPFVAAFTRSVHMRAADLKLNVNPEANVYVFPQIGGFVGGDTVAGIVATRLDQTTVPSLLVDIGTNGEIVLAHKGRLVATSVAAGPAFEGARITNGMRATSGAIEKVIVNGDLRINVIGNARPTGICGSGLIDAVAEMLRLGVLDSTGRIVAPEELPPATPDPIRRRVLPHGEEFCFALAMGSDTANGQPLCLYQRDIRELQLANAAIRAGINILLTAGGLTPADLQSILLAGAFGNFIRRRNARRIGMLPPIPCNHIRFVGNAASFGAKRALLSTAEKDYAERTGASTEHLDLSLDPGFQMEFGSAMILPDAEPADCVED